MRGKSSLLRSFGIAIAAACVLSSAGCGGMNTTPADNSYLEVEEIADASNGIEAVEDLDSEVQEVAVVVTDEEIVPVEGTEASVTETTEIEPIADDSVVALSETTDSDTEENTEVAALPEGDATQESKSEILTADSLPEAQILGMEIQQLGADNQLVARMDSPGFYTFSKTAPSEYVLILEGAAKSAENIQTIVTPPNSGEIRSVRPVVQGDDLALRIFANPETMLRVEPQGNTLTVASYRDGIDAESDGVMAQADVAELADNDAEDSDADLPDLDDLTQEILGGEEQYVGRLISLDLQDTDIDNALRIIAEVSNLNIIASDDVTGKVTLRLIDVPWDQALDVILKTNGLDKVQEGNVIRIAPVDKLRAERELLREAQQAQEELEPLKVRYIRVSYAKAADLQPLVETVLTERGTVAYDERTNQLIVKDITKGLRNVAKLVQKLDLRTPQVLIETQIIEAQRNFARSLGAELGFYYLRTPETGNALPYNFPNSMSIGGSAADGEGALFGDGTGSSFPAETAQSAVSLLFGSADGTKALDLRLSQAESDGRVKVVSRPSVAVTNNAPAVIKNVEKLRVRLPQGGVSVATGQGANAAGGGSVATEVIEIGIVLNVTAQASPDYYVLMDINAKSSTLGDFGRGIQDIPPEIERSANSTVLVSSGQTFAMGGIYRIDENDVVRGVPFLKDIPVIGHLFRSITVNDGDEELIFFITPRIIEGSFDDAAMKGVS